MIAHHLLFALRTIRVHARISTFFFINNNNKRIHNSNHHVRCNNQRNANGRQQYELRKIPDIRQPHECTVIIPTQNI